METILERLKAFEPIRTAEHNRSAAAWPHLQPEAPRSEAELRRRAAAELTWRRRFFSTPEGRFVRALSQIERRLLPDLQALLERAAQLQARGFEANLERCAELADAIDARLHHASMLAGEAASAVCNAQDSARSLGG